MAQLAQSNHPASEHEPGRMTRLALSFFSTVVGWMAGFWVFQARSLIAGRGFEEEEVMLYFPGIFSLAGWAVFFVPIVLFVPPSSAVFKPAALAGIGVVCAHVASIAFLSWWLGLHSLSYIAFAVTAIGFTAGLVYALACRSSMVRRPWAGLWLLAASVALIVLFSFVAMRLDDWIEFH